MIRVLLVDDQKLVRQGFALMLSIEDDIEVVGQAGNGEEAIALAEELRPDVILMDVQMPVLDGIAATDAIVERGLGRVVILTTFDRDDYLFDGLQAGASGFLLKNTDPEHLVEAVRAAALGHALLAPEVTLRVIRQATEGATERPDRPTPATATPGGSTASAVPGDPHLTDRENEVLRAVARGLSNAEVAAELFLGEATIKTHVSNCLMKLGLRDRVQLVVHAYRHGLAGPPPQG